MEIITIAKQHHPIKTAFKVKRLLEGAKVVYISEGTPNKRFEPLEKTGWIMVPAPSVNDQDYQTALLYIQKGYEAVFIRTSSVAGHRKIYVAKPPYRQFKGEKIEVTI